MQFNAELAVVIDADTEAEAMVIVDAIAAGVVGKYECADVLSCDVEVIVPKKVRLVA